MGQTPGQRHASAQQKANIAQRRNVVAANLLAGATYTEIAHVLNVSRATVASDVKALLTGWKEHYVDQAARYVNVQMRRYDVMLNALWNRAREGDLSSIDRVITIMDRQNRLMQIEKGTNAVSIDNGLVFNILPMPEGGAFVQPDDPV